MLHDPELFHEDNESLKSVQVSLESMDTIIKFYQTGKSLVSDFGKQFRVVLSNIHGVLSAVKLPTGFLFKQTNNVGFKDALYHLYQDSNIPVPLGLSGNLLGFMNEVSNVLDQVELRLENQIKDTEVRLTILNNQTDAYVKKYPITSNVEVSYEPIKDDRNDYYGDFKTSFVPLRVLVPNKQELLALDNAGIALYNKFIILGKKDYQGKLNNLDKSIRLMEKSILAALENKTLEKDQLIPLLESIDSTLTLADQLVSAATDGWASLTIIGNIRNIVH